MTYEALGSLGSMGGLFSTTVLYSIGCGIAVGGGLALFLIALRGLPAKPEHEKQKTAERAKDAADALGLTAPRLLQLGLIDKVVREPLGGAHRNPHSMAVRLKAVILNQLDELGALDPSTLLERRYERLRGYGAFATD